MITEEANKESFEQKVLREREERKQKLLADLKQRRTFEERSERYSRIKPTERIQEKITDTQENRKKELENNALEQDIILKKATLEKLFRFLSWETIAIFFLAIWQGFEWKGFFLEEWSFRLLVTVTITQITIMLLVAVKHLFPQK